MNKFSFIKHLLENEKFNSNQKERLLKLVSSELSKSEMNDIQVLNDINQIKKKIGLNVVNGNEEIDIKELKNKLRVEKDSSIELSEVSNEKASPGESPKIINKENNSRPVELTKEDKAPIESLNLPKYINPKLLYKFLLAYNQDPILKTTCHLVDQDELEKIITIIHGSEYDFENHIIKIIESFDKLEKEHFTDYRVKARIRGYLTGKDYKGKSINSWSADKIKINWSSSELLEWSKNNIGMPPNPDEDIAEKFENIGYEFDSFHSKIYDSKIKTFSELVIHFKYLFHLRSDNSLLQIIKNINHSQNWNEFIDFDYVDFWPNIEYFTDVDKLKQAYIKIIKLILEVKKFNHMDKPKVKLSFKELNNDVLLSIHHTNSVYKKTISNTIDKMGQVYLNLIENQVNGLCDLMLKADFGNQQYAEINLWNGKSRKETLIGEFLGVEHIFLFKK